MAMINSAAWNGQDQNISPTGDDDFQQFFDIGMSNSDSMPFDFQTFNTQNDPSMMHHSHRDPVDTPMSDANVSSIVTQNAMGVQNQAPAMTSAPSHPAVLSQILSHRQTPNDAISEIDAQIQFLQHQRLQQQQRQLEEQQRRLQEQQAALYAQQQQQQQQQQQKQQQQHQQQQQRNIIPPTPQSLEMQAASQFFASQDQAHSSRMFEGYQQMKDQQDMAFTPLVSPAVTPLDAHFPVDHQFMVPSAYFSPITSPALYPQSDPTIFYDPRHSGRTSRTTNSPAAMDIESPSAAPTTDTLPKETRKNSTSTRRKPKIRQSPITKPQRRKTASTPVMNAQALSELAEAVAEGSGLAPKPKSAATSSNEESDNASVSPEALEMPPPPLPLPRSARQSPYITPQNGDKPAQASLLRSQNGMPSPATPASLFRISPRNQTADKSHVDADASEHIENFELPESVNSINSINMSAPQAPITVVQQSPRTSPEAETPKMTPLRPLPLPVAAKPIQPASASQSPQLNPRPSASAPKKTPLMAPKGGRKRASISSISPALLPRISPNIKPLLPGTPGLSNEDSTSRLLASKSNYQRILEGNTVPGVTYPSELSTNLTSKRTSHKIAEQGRRNRINSALQEIATLLPKGTIKEASDGDGDNTNGDKIDAKQSGVPNSKASTVESAIEYIKHLQKELAEANQRADAAEKRLREATA
ncbi:putative phosphorus acquisition-controlling protein [Rosellinia necatrix]|uniref:Putative phosphorus acquisition-controlling protein n=1 Tax=Rosellinia necatrix TaxID=77044 RepID=A0A1W2TD79_ROSNE|nr:putative phosphorus acquisition-controlling protein [Rosellinia necatrix]